MKWNRKTFLFAMALLVLVFIPGGVFYMRAQGGWGFMMFRVEKWAKDLSGGEGAMTPREEAIAKREAALLQKVIFAKCPKLRVEDKEVDPEQNGYWLMIDLSKDPRLGQLIGLGTLSQLNNENIDPKKIRKELEPFHELGREIERIAALSGRSSVRQDKIHSELLPSLEVKTMGDYLVLNARLAAFEGNEAESFRFFSLAVNLAEHLGDIESPNFLSETVRILQRRGMRGELFTRILPSIGKSAILEKWNSVLAPQNDIPQRYAHLLRGEWSYFNEKSTHLLFGEMPDPEQTAITYARWVEASADKLGKMNLAQWGAAKDLPQAPFTKELSKEGVALIDELKEASIWRKGALRSAVMEHHYAAAMDLLIREQKGEDLSLLTETFLPNPYTGKPFGFNPATRTLDAVPEADGGNIEALKLPW